MTDILAAHEHVRRSASSAAPTPFEFFSAEQAAEVEAIAAQIIPTDSSAGAREARVIYFIDRALATFERDKQKLYATGLKNLQARLKKSFPAARRFSNATPEQQIQVLQTIEKTEFFEMLRIHTIAGFFANPEYGGNHDRAGWKLIGFEDAFAFEPPFGFYDREYKESQ